jgi:hypothetical protein
MPTITDSKAAGGAGDQSNTLSRATTPVPKTAKSKSLKDARLPQSREAKNDSDSDSTTDSSLGDNPTPPRTKIRMFAAVAGGMMLFPRGVGATMSSNSSLEGLASGFPSVGTAIPTPEVLMESHVAKTDDGSIFIPHPLQQRDDLKSIGGLRYDMHEIPAQDGHVFFFKNNTHPYLEGADPDFKPFVHPNYLKLKNTKDVGKDVMVHRALINWFNGVPENSKPGIDAAYAAGFRTLELDVMITKDGVPVLIHDATLGRITGDPLNRLVSDVTWDELKDMHLVVMNPATGEYIKTDSKVLKLEDVLVDAHDTKPDMGVVLDLKEQNSEAVFDLLLTRPELRPFVAFKPYGRGYVGGFDQFLGNLYQRYGIDPHSDEHRELRQDLRNTVKEMKVLPIFSQVLLTNEQVLRMSLPEPALKKYLSKQPVTDANRDLLTEEDLAGAAMNWIRGWGDGMDVKILEAHSTGLDTKEGRAMALLNEQLAAKGSGFDGVAMSASYRYEDFSTVDKDGNKKYYIYTDTGGIRDVTDDPIHAQRETAGSLRDDGDSLLTDQAQEEVYALGLGKALERGNTGNELIMKEGESIDVNRNQGITKLRADQYEAKKQKADTDYILAVKASRLKDQAAAEEGQGEKKSRVGAGTVAALAITGAAVVGYVLNRKKINRAAQRGYQSIGSGEAMGMARQAFSRSSTFSDTTISNAASRTSTFGPGSTLSRSTTFGNAVQSLKDFGRRFTGGSAGGNDMEMQRLREEGYISSDEEDFQVPLSLRQPEDTSIR